MPLTEFQQASFRHHNHSTEQIIDPDTGEPSDGGGASALDDLTDVTLTSAANNDILQRKVGVFVNRTIAQLLVDLAAAGTTFQPLDATLTALGGVSTAANKLIYATGSDTFTTTDLSSFIRTLLDDADATTARATLGVTPGATPEVNAAARLSAYSSFR